jgi:Apolipoprotein N-acyltransferase
LPPVYSQRWSFYYGTLKIDTLKETTKDAKSVEIALIQGNIDQSIKWNLQYQRETLNIYEDLSSGTMQSGQGLIVWPETAAPFFSRMRMTGTEIS